MTEVRARLENLPAEYPRLFPNGSLDWGFEHGDGWTQLIITLCQRLEAILQNDQGATLIILQVKEKFGELRFYYQLVGAQNETALLIKEAVDLAKTASTSICQSCGRPGELQNSGGWYSVTCTLCRPTPE